MATGATINCGSALAQNGAVTLDTNVINVCTTGAAGVILPPTAVLPPTIPGNIGGIAGALNPNALPPGFLELLLFLSPSELEAVLMQLNGELGTGAAQAGIQSMNSFLSLVTNPFGQFGESRFGPPPSRHPLIYKEPVYKAVHGATSDRRWNIWAAGYGGQNDADGNEVIGSHKRTVRGYGFATGLDYRIMPDTLVGFALAGGGTKFGLADAFGSGHSDMFQAAIYGLTRFDAAYLSAAVAYAWHHVSTDRILSLVNFDYLTADFSANNIAGRIEGGYRFAFPGVFGLPGFGFTPYGALQAQAFYTPSYNESGSSLFALAYQARTTNTTRTELGAWFDQTILLGDDAALSLRTRAAWANDNWSDPSVTAMFQSVPGSSFTVVGASPARDSFLSSANAEISLRNGLSLAQDSTAS